MRTIGIVTVARSDYGIYLPLLRKIHEDSDLRLHLIVSGMHLSPEFGLTVNTIEAEGFKIGERVEMLLSSDTPEGIAKSMALGTAGFAQTLARFRPDILVVLGDRFEMHALALAALPFKIPIAHIHGGEITAGAIDESLRHSITKLSHLHFVTTEEYARRVIQMGEEPWRVTVCGSPSLDNLDSVKLLSPKEMESRYGIRVDRSTLIVTYHPVTLEYEQTEWQIGELLSALETFEMPVVFTMPNADTCGRIIFRKIEAFIRQHEWAQMINNLGTEGYFSMMALADAMVGNSSSGIIEAASFALPVVNIGTRQKGRVRGDNVIDCGYEREQIRAALATALSTEFRNAIKCMQNPYGSGNAADKILAPLKTVSINQDLLVKNFYDIPEHTRS